MQYVKRAIYLFLKFLVRFSFPIFYRRTLVLGKERLRLKGPTILATNHPNTLVDALNAAGRVDQIVHFLVNAGLYNSSFSRRFFDFLFCIPVKRPQDPSPAGVNNHHSFDRCFRHLKKGGHLFIAPEGISVAGRRLRPLKMGTARIVLQVFDTYPQAPPIRVLPIGFTYSDPSTFGSELVVNVGQPILNTDYRDQYRENPRQAIRAFTAELEHRLEKLIVHTRNEEEVELVNELEHIQQAADPVDQEARFFRTRHLVAFLHKWQSEDPEDYRSFRIAVADYKKVLTRHRISSRALARHGESIIRHFLVLMLGLPIYLFGYLNNFLAAGIPRFLATRKFVDREYEATVQILLGLLTVPLFYLVQTWLMWRWLAPEMAIIYLLLLLPAGLFAWHYRQYWKRAREVFRLKSLDPSLQLKLNGQFQRFAQRLQKGLKDGLA